MSNIYRYKYQACPRCKCESILNDVTNKGEKVFQCLDCGYYNTNSKTISNPYGIIQYLRLSDWRKVARTIETEEEYTNIVSPMIDDPDVIYLLWSQLVPGMINKQHLK